MRVFVTGGTGSIGRQIVRRLIEGGDRAVVLSRRQGEAWAMPELRGAEVVQGDPATSDDWARHLEGCDAVINLVGHNIFGQRWSPAVKKKIRDSRVYGTQHVVSAIRKAGTRPGVLVQASAIGYYGFHADEELTEEAGPGADFMARICREWEEAAHPAEDLGVRVPVIRTGVVLAPGEGALGTMTPIFRWVPGGAAPVGGRSPLLPATGQQWLSWIHIDDIVGIFLLALNSTDARGPINGTAPNPVRNADFSRALAKAVHRPFVPLGPPDVMLRVLLGEVAQVVTKGQRVLPARAQAIGYGFRFPDVHGALRDLFARKAPAPAPAPPAPKPAAAAGAHH